MNAEGCIQRIGLLGDILLARRFNPSRGGLQSVLRGCDVVFANLEGLLHDYEAPPARPSGGTWTRVDPEAAEDLNRLGVTVVSLANNHAGDYGDGGARATVRHLRSVGIAVAGWGENLEEASRPAFVASKGATGAVIAIASTFPEHSMASDAKPPVLPRPGINPLRMEYAFQLPKADLQWVADTLRPLGIAQSGVGEGIILFGDHRFEACTTAGYSARPRSADLSRLIQRVVSAAAVASPVIVSHHMHPGKGEREEEPDEGQEAVAKAAIDAGARLVVGHGPHTLRSVEFYRDGVIFYGLGSVFLESLWTYPAPWDAYDDLGLPTRSSKRAYRDRRQQLRLNYLNEEGSDWGVAGIITIEGEAIHRVEAVPLHVVAGRPRVAKGDMARTILRRLRDLSSRRGTSVSLDSPSVITRAPR